MYYLTHLLHGGRSLRYPGLAAFMALFAVLGTWFLLSSHAASPLVGDLNGDGIVNVFDLSILLSHWQQTGINVTGDLNNDGTVNIFDLSILLSNWGQTISGGAAPVSTVGPYFTASTGTAAACTNGCAVVGQAVGVSTGTWTNNPTSYTYQWERCITTSAQPPTTGSCSEISGATNATYTVQAADIGHSLVPIVTATNASGSTSTSLTGTCNTGEMLGIGGNGSNLYTPTVPTTQPAGCSPISAVAATTTGGQKFCTNAVTTCGYADPLNQTVGVPANVRPSTSGACASYANGATISSGTVTITGCKITGTISVTGGNVTITNSDITKSDITQATGGVVIGSGAGTVSLSHDTIHGADYTSTGSLSFAVYEKTNAPPITEDHVFSYNADRLLMNYSNPAGTPMVTNSFCWHNGDEGSEHYECVYTGTPSNISVQNSTLINLSDQTAANYVDDNTPWETGAGQTHTIDVENNILIGGSFTVYGGYSATCSPYSCPLVTSNADTFIGNRFSRALYTTGGYFGPSGKIVPSPTESGNIWDDTGATFSP